MFKNLTANKILTSAAIIACIISALHIFFCIDVYDDIAAWYAPMTRAFAREQWHIAFDLSVPILNTTLGGLLSSCGMEPFPCLVSYLMSFLPGLNTADLLYIQSFFQKR